MEPGVEIDWERTGLLLGVALAALALLGKVTSWRPVQWVWTQVKRFLRWLGRAIISPLFHHELKAAKDRDVRVAELEDIVVRLERDITVVGDRVTTALMEIGERVDESICACRDSIANLAHETRDSIGELTEAQRGTNRILQSVVTLQVGPDEVRKALAEAVLKQDVPAEYKGEDRRSRRARGDRLGEELRREKGAERREPRTRDEQ